MWDAYPSRGVHCEDIDRDICKHTHIITHIVAGHHVVRIGIISTSSTHVRAIHWFVPNKWLVDLHGTKGVCTKLSPQLAEGRGQIIWLTWGYPHSGGDSNGAHLSAGIKDEKCQNNGWGSCGFLLKSNACSMGSVCFSLGVRIHSSISINPIFLDDALYYVFLFEHGWVMSTVLVVSDPAGHSW